MTVVASCYGYDKLVRVKGKMNGAEYRAVVGRKTFQSAGVLTLWWGFIYQQDNDSKETGKGSLEGV